MKFLTAILVLVAFAAPAWAQTTAPADAGFTVTQWSVFLLDASQNQLNPDGLVNSTLPDFIDSHRQAMPSTAPNATPPPMPISVIRMSGQADGKIDVTVDKIDGDFEASWPKAESRTSQLLWRNLTLSDRAAPGTLQTLPEDNWLAPLRKVDSGYLTNGDNSAERFLLYDAQMNYISPLKVKRNPDFTVQITNTSNAPLHSVALYQSDHGSWRGAQVGELSPATRPTTAPDTMPTSRPAIPLVTLHPIPATQPSDLADQWKPALLAAGLAEGDCETIVQILSANAFDSARLTAIYMLDPSEFDRIYPLEVLPTPTRTLRVGIVIVKYVDPTAGTEIDDLIAQLGDPVWAKRQQAYLALEKLGATAVPKLHQAAQSKDLEIVWRAERLLAEQQQRSGQQ